jgi:hypothetical protein
MRINLDDRLDKEYPEPSECEVNDRNCEYTVDTVCHECGTVACDACSVGVRHQPQLSKYTYPQGQDTERIQQHCPDCALEHTLNPRNLAVGGGGVTLGLLFVGLGGTNTLALTLTGIVIITFGAYLLRYEYRLKARHNDEYGITSMW